MAIMGFSLGLTVLLVLFQRFVVHRTRSLIVEADALHYTGDVLVNAVIILSLYLSDAYGIWYADPILASLIAAYIVRAAWKIGIRAFHNLMDRELPDEEKLRILETARHAEGILGIHDLKTRCSGRKVFIQFHAELDDSLALRQAHAITDRLEASLLRQFPEADILIHQDPAPMNRHPGEPRP